MDIVPSATATALISQPGSYVLVADVRMLEGTPTCIQLTADDVTLDLGGHLLRGAGTGTGWGILQSGANRATIHNGVVEDFGGGGMMLGFDAHLFDLHVSGNGARSDGHYLPGIWVGPSSIIERVVVSHNRGSGIQASAFCRVRHCRVDSNGTKNNVGIEVSGWSFVSYCVCCNNGHNSTQPSTGAGLQAIGDACTLVYNTCSGNSAYSSGNAYGIRAAGSGHRIAHNVCNDNDAAGDTSEGAYGIYAGSHCTITDNVCEGNDTTGPGGLAVGLYCIDACLVERNACCQNAGASPIGTAFGLYAT